MSNTSYMSKRLKDDFTDDELDIGLYGSMFAVIVTSFQMIIFPVLSKRLYIPYMMCLGCFIEIIGWFIAAFFNKFLLVISGSYYLILGYGFTMSCPSVLVTYIVSPDKQGRILGTILTFTSLSQILSPLIYGSLYDINHQLPFFISCAFCIIFIFL